MDTAAPSGKFWIPIPIATEIAAKTAARGSSELAAAPKATPTAKPSGILCNVMEKTNRIVRFKWLGKPSVSWLGPKCICGNVLSAAYKNSPPNPKPILTTSHGISPFSSARAIAGSSNDQKLAAIITPEANPNIVFRTFLLISLKK